MLNSPVAGSHSPLTLVTGGAGFLGSHLCDRLLAEGHEVICLDNLITGRKVNISHLLNHPKFWFVHHDVTRPIELPTLLGGAEVRPGFNLRPLNYLLHFASPASPSRRRIAITPLAPSPTRCGRWKAARRRRTPGR